MRATLAKDLAERDARSRDNRRLFSGQVIAVNTITHTLRVLVTQDGTTRILERVSYLGQTPPTVGDFGDIVYNGSSVHSARFVARLSGVNPQSSLTVVGGVETFNGVKGAIIAAVDWDFFRITATSPALASDQTKLYMRLFDDGVTGRTLTLPDPTSHRNPIWIRVLAAPAGGHTIARFGSENIDGTASNLVIGTLTTQLSDVVLVSDGTDWWIMGERIL